MTTPREQSWNIFTNRTSRFCKATLINAVCGTGLVIGLEIDPDNYGRMILRKVQKGTIGEKTVFSTNHAEQLNNQILKKKNSKVCKYSLHHI